MDWIRSNHGARIFTWSKCGKPHLDWSAPAPAAYRAAGPGVMGHRPAALGPPARSSLTERLLIEASRKARPVDRKRRCGTPFGARKKSPPPARTGDGRAVRRPHPLRFRGESNREETKLGGKTPRENGEACANSPSPRLHRTRVFPSSAVSTWPKSETSDFGMRGMGCGACVDDRLCLPLTRRLAELGADLSPLAGRGDVRYRVPELLVRHSAR
jgi:hypothetical protein